MLVAKAGKIHHFNMYQDLGLRPGDLYQSDSNRERGKVRLIR